MASRQGWVASREKNKNDNIKILHYLKWDMWRPASDRCHPCSSQRDIWRPASDRCIGATDAAFRWVASRERIIKDWDGWRPAENQRIIVNR